MLLCIYIYIYTIIIYLLFRTSDKKKIDGEELATCDFDYVDEITGEAWDSCRLIAYEGAAKGRIISFSSLVLII